MAPQGLQKYPSDRPTFPHRNALSLVRIFRGSCIALSILWMVLFHVGIISQAPFRVPFRVKLSNTIITVISVIMLIFCCRGRARVVLGWLMVLLAVLTLWGYWNPAFF